MLQGVDNIDIYIDRYLDIYTDSVDMPDVYLHQKAGSQYMTGSASSPAAEPTGEPGGVPDTPPAPELLNSAAQERSHRQ